MQDIVRAQGRLSKKGGKMISSGTDEFQIASGAALDSLLWIHLFTAIDRSQTADSIVFIRSSDVVTAYYQT